MIMATPAPWCGWVCGNGSPDTDSTTNDGTKIAVSDASTHISHCAIVEAGPYHVGGRGGHTYIIYPYYVYIYIYTHTHLHLGYPAAHVYKIYLSKSIDVMTFQLINHEFYALHQRFFFAEENLYTCIMGENTT